MTKFSLVTGIVLAAVLLTMLSPGKSPVIELAHADEEDREDRITVVAPRVTRERARPGSRTRVETIERSAMVDFDDLDLQRTTDMFTLEARIQDAATRICEELAESYPQGQPSTAVCIQRAVDDAMADARLLARGE